MIPEDSERALFRANGCAHGRARYGREERVDLTPTQQGRIDQCRWNYTKRQRRAGRRCSPCPRRTDVEAVTLAAPSGQALEDCDRVLASFAPLTQATYRRAVERFASWTRGRGITNWKQVTDRLLANYVEHLRDARGLGHASATVEVSAIRTVARAMGCPVLDGPLASAALTTMRKSAEMQKRRRGQAVPIRWAKADAAACVAEAEGSVIGLQGRGDLRGDVGRDFCGSRELVALDCEHVTGEEDGSGRVFVARSKTDPGRDVGASLYLGPSTLEAEYARGRMRRESLTARSFAGCEEAATCRMGG